MIIFDAAAAPTCAAVCRFAHAPLFAWLPAAAVTPPMPATRCRLPPPCRHFFQRALSPPPLLRDATPRCSPAASTRPPLLLFRHDRHAVFATPSRCRHDAAAAAPCADRYAFTPMPRRHAMLRRWRYYAVAIPCRAAAEPRAARRALPPFFAVPSAPDHASPLDAAHAR